MAKQIKLQYQVKILFENRWEARTLTHDCDPNKSDKENLDDAFARACEFGADTCKLMRWKFID